MKRKNGIYKGREKVRVNKLMQLSKRVMYNSKLPLVPTLRCLHLKQLELLI